MELRDYQAAAMDELEALWGTRRAVILQMGTGAGKTVTAAAWIARLVEARRPIVVGWLVHTGHLRRQAGRELERAGVDWIDFSTVAPSQRRWEPGRVHCFGAAMKLPHGPHSQDTLLVVDECHRSASDTYAAQMDKRRSGRRRVWRRVLGLSATPARYGWPDTISASQTLFSRQWDAMVRGPAPVALVDAGHLADVDVISDDGAGGDWDLLVADRMRASGFTSRSERAWERTLSIDAAARIVAGQPERPTVWFVASQSAARQLRKILGAQRCAVVLADTNANVRRHAIEGFEAGDIGHLVTVRALLEGTDIPAAKRIVQLAPSSSKVLLSQAAGRGARPPGRMELWDFSRSWSMIGAHPLDDIAWHLSLDATADPAAVTAATAVASTCPTDGCGTVVSPRTHRLCPRCGFEVVRRCVACLRPMTVDVEDGTHRRCIECAAAERAHHSAWARSHGVEPVTDRDATADAGGSAAVSVGLEALENLRQGIAVLERQLGHR